MCTQTRKLKYSDVETHPDLSLDMYHSLWQSTPSSNGSRLKTHAAVNEDILLSVKSSSMNIKTNKNISCIPRSLPILQTLYKLVGFVRFERVLTY